VERLKRVQVVYGRLGRVFPLVIVLSRLENKFIQVDYFGLFKMAVFVGISWVSMFLFVRDEAAFFY